jgi:hypothetical protein
MEIDITNWCMNYDCINRRDRTNTKLDVNRTSLRQADIDITDSFIRKVLAISYN